MIGKECMLYSPFVPDEQAGSLNPRTALSQMVTRRISETTCLCMWSYAECACGMCMWCKNLRMCTDRNAYLASFPYGQCMDWTTQINHCPDLTKKPNGKTK